MVQRLLGYFVVVCSAGSGSTCHIVDIRPVGRFVRADHPPLCHIPSFTTGLQFLNLVAAEDHRIRVPYGDKMRATYRRSGDDPRRPFVSGGLLEHRCDGPFAET